MKSRGVTLFGLPTLLTVFIVITVLSFATLSLLSANSDRNALKRTTSLVASTYALQSMTEEKIATLAMELTMTSENNENIDVILSQFLLKHPEITYNNINRTFDFSMEYSVLRMDVTLKVGSIANQPFLTRTSYRLSTKNGQDYSLDGDPVWGG